jgi:hypothetical protein
MSHTYAILTVSRRTFDEIKQKLRAAKYDQAFVDVETLDMHGIALEPEDEKPHTLRIAKDESSAIE